MIFLDNASTSKVFPAVIRTAATMGEELFYNPSALYGEALKVKNLVEDARATIAAMLGADREEIYFTSCATESNNWAFEKGIKNKKGNIVVSSSEHASAYESALVQKSKGIDVRFAALNRDGTVNREDLLKKVDENTCFVSVIHCLNETGAVNDISALSTAVKKINPKALFHSDGVQAFAKMPTSVKSLGVDLYSISAHKVGGFKGVGALYIRHGVNIAPLISGGGQERGSRSGTENVVGIVSFAQAAEEYKRRFDRAAIREMRRYIATELSALEVRINGPEDAEAIISLTIPGIKAEILQHMLSDKGVLIGLGSACSSKSRNNRVLAAMGLGPKEIEGSVRLSLGVDNTMSEVVEAVAIMKEDIRILRGNINER